MTDWPYPIPPQAVARPIRIRIQDGRLQVWDDDPPEEFGQAWITVCAWCHRGPLNDSDGAVCGQCQAVGPQP